jgi:hypothetical protein
MERKNGKKTKRSKLGLCIIIGYMWRAERQDCGLAYLLSMASDLLHVNLPHVPTIASIMRYLVENLCRSDQIHG